MSSLRYTLPFPPSVNALFGGGSRQRRFPTKQYKSWLAGCPKLFGACIDFRVKITYWIYFPDKRVRDGQNYLKAPLDYLVKEQILVDDNRNIVCGETWEDGGIDKENPRIEIEIIRC